MSAKDYKAKYDQPLRSSWLNSDAKAMEEFKKIGRNNKNIMQGNKSRASLKNGQWSRKYKECVNCGGTWTKHIGKGLCKTCWSSNQGREHTKSKNKEIAQKGEEGIDFVTCQICNMPFEALTSEGHLKQHGISETQYQDKYNTRTQIGRAHV